MQRELQIGGQDTAASRGAKAWCTTQRGLPVPAPTYSHPLLLALLYRETKDWQDLEALQVLWESQARR